MSKTLSELSRSLKEFIAESQDAHTSGDIKKYRYNNLKIDISDPRTTKIPQVIITIGMSEASFDIMTGEKISGGLGPDEKYIFRWLDRGSNRGELITIMKNAQRHIGKAQSGID